MYKVKVSITSLKKSWEVSKVNDTFTPLKNEVPTLLKSECAKYGVTGIAYVEIVYTKNGVYKDSDTYAINVSADGITLID